jgi:Tat protein secretion system quality control protein TatD with DNase activity
VHIAQTVAELRGESLDTVAAITTRNAETLFGWR